MVAESEGNASSLGLLSTRIPSLNSANELRNKSWEEPQFRVQKTQVKVLSCLYELCDLGQVTQPLLASLSTKQVTSGYGNNTHVVGSKRHNERRCIK